MAFLVLSRAIAISLMVATYSWAGFSGASRLTGGAKVLTILRAVAAALSDNAMSAQPALQRHLKRRYDGYGKKKRSHLPPRLGGLPRIPGVVQLGGCGHAGK